MLNLNEMFGFDKKKAEEGVKMFLGSDKETEYVVVKRFPNDGYTIYIRELMLENNEKLEALETTDKKAAHRLDVHLQNVAVGKEVIVELGPAIAVNGKPVENTPEAITQLLDDYPDFKTKVLNFASERTNFPLDRKPVSRKAVKKS